MFTGLAIRSFAEVLIIALLIVAVFNNDRLVVIEDRIILKIKRKMRARRRRKAIERKLVAQAKLKAKKLSEKNCRSERPAACGDMPVRRYSNPVYDRRVKTAGINTQGVA